MLNKVLNVSSNKWYWLVLLLLGISLEVAALFYQYVLDYPPCVLCIHVRIWVFALILLSFIALKVHKTSYGLISIQVLMTVVSIGLVERSYQLLGTERGFVFGECNMESGLPAWFALDSWFPSVFKIGAACGYTPELIFGITMAEALMVMSSILLLLSSFFTLYLLIQRFNKHLTG